MWIDNFGQEAVDFFWRLCGEVEEYPRSLERPLSLTLPIALVKLPRLRLWDIEDWMRQRGCIFDSDCENRAVRGCMIAYGGRGLLFVDGTDPEDERRFTVAHEIAHFLIEYWLPRTRVIDRLGSAVVDVIDGRRPPTATERVQAIFSNINLGPYRSLLERSSTQDNPQIWNAENKADWVAINLLAPFKVVLSYLDLTLGEYESRFQTVKEVLQRNFGLPNSVAISYGHALLTAVGRGPSWVELLRSR